MLKLWNILSKLLWKKFLEKRPCFSEKIFDISNLMKKKGENTQEIIKVYLEFDFREKNIALFILFISTHIKVRQTQKDGY